MNHPIWREDPEGQVPIPVTNLPDSEPISIQDRPQTHAERDERRDITRTPHSVGGSPRTSRTQLIEATKALGANQRELAEGQRELKEGQRELKSEVASLKDELSGRVRSLEDGQAELKDLLIRALDK